MIEKILEGIKNIVGEERDSIAFLYMNREKKRQREDRRPATPLRILRSPLSQP